MTQGRSGEIIHLPPRIFLEKEVTQNAIAFYLFTQKRDADAGWLEMAQGASGALPALATPRNKCRPCPLTTEGGGGGHQRGPGGVASSLN